jgi:hypothetical protein
MSSSPPLSWSFDADYLRGAEVVSARELSATAGTIKFRYSDKAGFVTEVHYQN